ncbi:hypothetical protein LTR37_013456 [Vermiconidia calcicola]|uniref:Uncharacterized protein n=1 Tax=Vermiconidia calcicola TaxID=1690605 RepID=A0ACC3MWY1_9PEZI|nr:hypothetical protein LTR37_013456 [Vermiconidia calcicola]
MSGLSAAAAGPVLDARNTRTSFSVTTVQGPVTTWTYSSSYASLSVHYTYTYSGEVNSTKEILIEDVASITDVETTNTMVVLWTTLYTNMIMADRQGNAYTSTSTSAKPIASTVMVLRVPGPDSETMMRTEETGTTGTRSSRSLPSSTGEVHRTNVPFKHLVLAIAIPIVLIAIFTLVAGLLWHSKRRKRRTATLSKQGTLDVRQCHSERMELGNDAGRKAELEVPVPLSELETPKAEPGSSAART